MIDRYPENLVVSKISKCDTFKSLMCHTTAIYLSLTILSITYGLCGLIWNLYAARSFKQLLQKSSVLCSRPYSNICIWTYNRSFPLLITMKYFWCLMGGTFATIPYSAPSINVITYNFISVCKYIPGMKNVTTTWPSCASNSAVRNT